jgi:3-oxoacyl-[acyl-carrier protein] reductase
MEYALVTGGSRGIGKAVAIKLARMGWPVVINYRGNTEAAEATKNEIEEFGGKAELLRFDCGDKEAIEEALALFEEQHPDDYIGVLVNNAGIRKDNLMIFMQNEEWHQVMDTSLNAFFYITRRLLKNMLTHRHGRIINMTSLSGVKGMPGQTNYSAAKGAIISATKALAQEVAKRKVTVNAVAPGFISTDMTADLDEKELSKLIPLGRFGKPEEVANVVGFLASNEADYITGQCIQVNGGLY